MGSWMIRGMDRRIEGWRGGGVGEGIEGKKEMFYLYNALDTFYLTVLWHWTYNKEPLRQREKKSTAATTWATLYN